MNKEQQAHLDNILVLSLEAIEAKYKIGAKKHGGTLIDMSINGLLDEAILEAVDQMVYLLTMRQKLNKK